jgi:hypothetical protein
MVGNKIRGGRVIRMAVGILALVLMLAVSTTVAQPIATNFGVSDAQGNQNTFVLVPVNITNAQNGPIAGILFRINFNSSVINLTSARVNRGDLISVWDAPTYSPVTGLIQVVFSSSGTGISNGTSGSVVLLNFSVIGSPGATSNMSISRIQLSDESGFNVGTAPANNGTFKVDARPPSVTNLYANTVTTIPPVTTSGQTPTGATPAQTTSTATQPQATTPAQTISTVTQLQATTPGTPGFGIAITILTILGALKFIRRK